MSPRTLADSDDELMSADYAAKRGNMSLATFRALPPGLRPMTLWRSDIERWSRWQAQTARRVHKGGAS